MGILGSSERYARWSWAKFIDALCIDECYTMETAKGKEMSKWYFISIGAFLVATGISMGVQEYQKGQCRQAGMMAGKTAEEIIKICK
jgi:hypothetical protein